MRLLIMGPPGSGKGTQGERLAERLQVRHVAAGDLLRHEVEQDTPLGRQVADQLAAGELVDDSLIIELLLPTVEAAARDNGFVLDGFPRSIPQAVLAQKLAEDGGFSLDAAVYLDVPRRVLLERILNRARVEGRNDDTEEVITTRLNVFDEATRPLGEFYRRRGLLHVIDAERDPDEITAAILTSIGASGPPAPAGAGSPQV